MSYLLTCYLVAQLCPTFVTPWTTAHHTFLSFTISQSLLELVSIESSRHLILSHPLLFLPSIFPSIRVFSSELALCLKWPKYWSFSFSISPFNVYSGMISLVVQGTLKTLLQHHSLKASLLWCSSFFKVQLSHPYMTTEKTISLNIRTCFSKVISLLFNMLSRMVVTFLPRSKCLLISWMQLPFRVILEPKKNKVCHCFQYVPFYFPWNDGTGCLDLSFLKVEF